MAKQHKSSLSMRLSAQYKTQSAMWDVEFTGMLGDRAITRYALAGRYGPELQKHYEEAAASKHQPKPRRSTRLAQLFASL